MESAGIGCMLPSIDIRERWSTAFWSQYMNKRFIIRWPIVGSIFLLCLSRAGAQVAPPAPPFVKAPPDFATWTMTVSHSDGSPIPQPAPPSSGRTAATALASLELRQQQVV